ncbi:MAG: sulfur transfer protein SirA [Methanomassiliicoccales archaeon PtaB.Bin215]|nr:MAG: sulfur transfer protein SirA [Methanomassiliicoccales archaeon PtaB.Bin215]
MATVFLDTLGKKCPQPILEVAVRAKQMKPGDVLEVVSDCHSFNRDVDAWCKKAGKTLLFVGDQGGGKWKAQIQF